jgi:hypothetical protein
MRESLRWLGHFADEGWQIVNIVLLGPPSRAEKKANCPQMGWEGVVRKERLKGNWSFLGGCKEGGFE